MKTKIIKSLKKELLVIEDSPAIDFYEINPRMLAFNMINGSIKTFKGNYTLLGKVNEIKEEYVEDLVDNFDFNFYVDYNHPSRGAYTSTAIESFNSALEKNLFWENNVSKQLAFIGNVSEIDKQIALQKQERRWQQAQEKTFDKNRTLIFIKN